VVEVLEVAAMSSRRRMPHIVGTSPIAWYGSIIGPNGPATIPFFAAWPGAPVCWAQGLEWGAKR
jgi:hypothetical protein